MIETKVVSTLTEALELHKSIVGYGFYEGFENTQSRDESLLNELRTDEYGFHVDSKGNIYYVVRGDHGERLLNKLTLHSMLTSGGFAMVVIMEHKGEGIIFPPNSDGYKYDRCVKNRKLWGKHPSKPVMTTEYFNV